MKAVQNPMFRRSRSGFTLVEMLVVITIIGVLAALVIPAASMVVRRVKQAAIGVEISQLDAALKMYKEKFGEYPPDFSIDLTTSDGTATVMRHVAKAFPRCTLTWAQFINAVGTATAGTGTGLDATTLTPQTALMFWLGGCKDSDGNLCGFAADPTNPFQMSGTATGQCAARIKPFFEFDRNRESNYMYWPRNASGERNTGAIVYFRAENGEYTTDGTKSGTKKSHTDVNDSAGQIYAACDSRQSSGTTVVWMNPGSFQIFSAGMDLRYGNPGSYLLFPDGGNYNNDGTGRVYDNITNFTDGKTLDACVP